MAFEQLFIQFKDRVYEIAMHYTDHAPELSEEIVQDVFLKVWLKKVELTSIQDIEHCLYTLAKRRSFDVMRGIAIRRRTKGELAH